MSTPYFELCLQTKLHVVLNFSQRVYCNGWNTSSVHSWWAVCGSRLLGHFVCVYWLSIRHYFLQYKHQKYFFITIPKEKPLLVELYVAKLFTLYNRELYMLPFCQPFTISKNISRKWEVRTLKTTKPVCLIIEYGTSRLKRTGLTITTRTSIQTYFSMIHSTIFLSVIRMTVL